MLSLSCEECGEEIEVAFDKQGKTIGCPACEHPIAVPWQQEDSADQDGVVETEDEDEPLPLLNEIEADDSEAEDEPVPAEKPSSRFTPLMIRLRYLLGELLVLANTFSSRVLASNCATVKPLPREREQLEQDTPAITDDLAQRYLCWRRAMLWYAAMVWVVIALLTTWDWFSVLNNEKMPFGFGANAMITLVFLMQMVGYFAIGCAAWQWNHVIRSIWLSRVGWLMIFFSPFIFTVFPLVSFLEFQEGMKAEAKMLTGFVMGTFLLMTVIPYFVGVFPALTRSMLTLKTLLPEFAGLGWFLVVIVPIYSLVLLTISFAVNQVGFYPMLIVGSLCIALAPISYLLDRNLFRPQQQDAASELVTTLRQRVRLVTGMGCLLVFLFLSSSGDVRASFQVVVRELAQDSPVSWVTWQLLRFMVKLFGSIVLLTVVSSDIVVFALLRWHEQQFDEEEARLAGELQIKLGRLHQAGFSKSLHLQLPQLPQRSSSERPEENGDADGATE